MKIVMIKEHIWLLHINISILEVNNRIRGANVKEYIKNQFLNKRQK